MKKIFYNLFLFSLIIFFSFSFLINTTEAQVPCASTHVFYNNKCIERSIYEVLFPSIKLTPGEVQPQEPINTYTPLAPLPGLDKGLNFDDSCPLANYLNTMFDLIVGVIIVIAMVKLVLGGLEYVTSESISGKANAKDSIIAAFGGLVLALGSYIILNSINPNLLNLCPDITPVTITIDDIVGDLNVPFANKLNKEELKEEDIHCPGTGGVSELSKIAQSFVGKSVIYSQNQRETISGNNIYLDCSSFVAQVYSCAGLSAPGGSTHTMFSSADRISSNFESNLKVGDLLGWKEGETKYRGGHVVMYLGNNTIIEVAGPRGRNPAVLVRNLNAYRGSYNYVVKP